MEVYGLLLLFVLGIVVVQLVACKISPLFKVGMAFPIGFGINAFLMFALDVAHIPLSNFLILLGIETLLVLLLFTYLLYKRRLVVSLVKEWQRVRQKISAAFQNIHPTWVVLMAAIVFLMGAALVQAFFWPVFIYDSMTGFDFMARVSLKEGTLNNSIFNPDYPVYTLRSVYPPLVALNFAFLYGIGLSSSHGIVVLCYVSMAISFYAVLRLYTTHFMAALFTLLLMITPEYASFSILSSSNPVCAYYVSVGLLCLYVAYERGSAAYSTAGMLLTVFSLWTRPEAIVFAAFAGAFALWTGIRQRAFIKPLVFGVVCLAVFVSWQLYVKLVLPIDPPNTLMTTLAFDPDKLLRMLAKVQTVTFDTRYYGIIIYLFLTVVVINIKSQLVYKDRLALLLLLCGGWAIYVLVFYQIDTDFKPGETNWIEDAYRRGLFCFFPLMIFYIATNRLTDKLFRRYLTL